MSMSSMMHLRSQGYTLRSNAGLGDLQAGDGRASRQGSGVAPCAPPILLCAIAPVYHELISDPSWSVAEGRCSRIPGDGGALRPPGALRGSASAYMGTTVRAMYQSW